MWYLNNDFTYRSTIKRIIVRVANETSVCKTISKTAANPTAVNPEMMFS